jgi:hypothetical protein
MRAAAVLAFAASCACLALASCAPSAPKGVNKDKLDAAVSDAIGDPATCVMMAEQPSGKVVYRYNTATACDRVLPSCEGAGQRKLKDLLAQVAKDGQRREESCNTTADASRGVSWLAAPTGRKGIVYAAVMEGTRTFPARMMSERLEPPKT